MSESDRLEIISKSKSEYPEEIYHNHILELYKLYVEMTDRISQRRDKSNSWFLTIHTALLTLIGLFFSQLSNTIDYIHIFIAIVGIIACVVWKQLILSYKQMNSGRFKVIHAIEKELPLKLYDAEWKALGEGKNRGIYRPFTQVEKWIPFVFIAMYLIIIFVSIIYELY